jgi:membrane protein YdbS with pleckstrin-like domain
MHETRQHPFAIVQAFIDAVMLFVPLLVAMWGIDGIKMLDNVIGDTLIYAAFAIMLVLVCRLFWRILEWEFARVLVTSEKLVHVHGILNRRIASTPLVKVSELTVSQPLLGRVFGYGSLVIDTPGGGELPLHGLSYIPDPAAMYRMITDVARHERAWEGGAAVDPAPDTLPRDWYAGGSDDDDEDPGDTIVIRRPPKG